MPRPAYVCTETVAVLCLHDEVCYRLYTSMHDAVVWQGVHADLLISVLHYYC